MWLKSKDIKNLYPFDKNTGQQLTEEEQALVEGVEFGRDYNLQVSDEDARKYEELINEFLKWKVGDKSGK